ncbi:hypothetical protein AWF65_17010 [Escherichia coli]|nr:hypothetical protein RG41_17865 [Escherichia coli]ATC15271.1 hypothetical protein CNQ47_00815 [Escherichia coli]KUW45543.1 hypothetical protein AWF65_17010 [Escherichia coli]KXL21889.1 hypothetical protein AXH12_04255 [Escherichia coli]OAO51725.1 hypothetical protein OO98_24540 [Escherichia coli]
MRSKQSPATAETVGMRWMNASPLYLRGGRRVQQEVLQTCGIIVPKTRCIKLIDNWGRSKMNILLLVLISQNI